MCAFQPRYLVLSSFISGLQNVLMNLRSHSSPHVAFTRKLAMTVEDLRHAGAYAGHGANPTHSTLIACGPVKW